MIVDEASTATFVGEGWDVTRDPRSEVGREPRVKGGEKEGERETEEGEVDNVVEADWGILQVPKQVGLWR